MPLILAIEPDKRQSSQLTSLVKELPAELVLRGNAADGLAALQGRVPDLVLTTSLISPRDDSSLAAHLRELGAAAAHVQTVTIPLLGTAAPARARGGMLAALRREKPQEPMTDGCAPDVFAEQIHQYLATAEEQKVTAATRLVAAAPAVAAVALEDPVEDDAEPVEELPALVAEFTAPELEPVAEAPMFAAEPWPPVADAIEAVEPIVAAPVIEAIAETVEADEAEDLLADEPAGLPLSQLLQLVSDRAVSAVSPAAPETVGEIEAVAPVFEQAVIEPEPLVEIAAAAEIEPEPTPVSDLDDMLVDPVAAQALDELSLQAPPSSLADGVPAEAPVPVVEMYSFQSLDAIASELAAEPAARHESLDDLATLFAAPLHGDADTFASLFAEPAPPTQAEPIEVPGIDPSLFATASATPAAAFEPAPEPLMAPTFDLEQLAAAEPVLPEPETVVAALPELEFEAALEPMFAQLASPEPEPAVASAIAAEPEPELEQLADDTLITFEPVVFEPAYDEPIGVAAAPAFDEDEISLDVDSFEIAQAVPSAASQASAEPSRFSFTLVDGFGDALSDFEVPTIAAVAADLGVGEHPPLDPGAAATRTAARAAGEPLAAPALDQESLSLIGDAARKVSLDSMVIEEFERGFPGRRVKKAKKKAHAGATQVTPSAERPAKPVKRPVQDEWGMFDPEQCGFAALEDEEGAENRPTTGTRVRVISY